MARSFGKDVKNNFFRGVVTEFSGMNFPEDAAIDASNVIFSQNEGVYRRPGIDYEDDYVVIHGVWNQSQYVVKEYIWENVGAYGDLAFLVLQISNVLYFYQISDTGALSRNRKAFAINLDGYKTGTTPGAFACEFSQGNGHLFAANPNIFPLRIQYIGAANGVGTLSILPINTQIRDLEGAQDGLPVDHRPNRTTNSNAHMYNLYNQGWYGRVKAKGISGRINAVQAWRSFREDLPSNSDVWWNYRNENNAFDPDFIDRSMKGTEAPKGHFLLWAFHHDRSGVMPEAPGIPVTYSTGFRPACVAFFGNRIWLGGTPAAGFQDKIYYSQVLIGETNYHKAYMKADPTDENTPGLLPTDGGVIAISDIGRVVKIIPLQNYLLVFATNGIWSISGGSTNDFRADDYSVQKVSDIQSLSATSFVLPKTGFPIWWNADGIYSLQLKENSESRKQTIEVISLTDETIKSMFADIPSLSKKYAKGAYNPLENKIQWVYWTRQPTNNPRLYHYDHILNYDMTTGAFYTWELPRPEAGAIDEDSRYPIVAGIIVTRGSGVDFDDVQITSTDGDVTDNSLDAVTTAVSRIVPLTSSFRYTTVRRTPELGDGVYDVSFSQFKSALSSDWVNEVPFDSHFTTGAFFRGEAQRPFQNNIIYVYTKAVEGSSCFLQGIWDFSIDDHSGRETSAHQCFIDRSFVGTQRRKIRLRGRGHALQLKFFSEDDKPFNILGWSSFQSANNIP